MILKNALVLQNSTSEVRKADLRIENGKISEIGNIDGEGMDLSGKLIMPAFYNTHTHAAMTIMRGVSDDDPFDVWLFKKVLPVEDKLDGKKIYYGTILAMMEMASKGIAGFVDMYFFLDDVAKAVEDFGMRALITRGLVDENGDDNGRLKENLNFAKKWGGRGLIKAGFGPHAPYSCSKEYLKRIADVARVENLPVHIHLYEASWEREKYDYREILKIFDGVKLIAAHAVQFEENEIKDLAKENIFVSHNPTSNLKLGNGIAKVAKMLEKGVNVSLGTDGAASNNSLDIWHEMRLAALLQKKSDPESMKIHQALEMATEAGAKVLEINAGRIEIGMEADLVVIDLNKPHYMPIERLKSHIVHSGMSSDVFATMVAGNWVYYDGNFPNIDKEEVIKEFEKEYKLLMEGDRT